MQTEIYPGVYVLPIFAGRMQGFVVGAIHDPQVRQAVCSGDAQDVVNLWGLESLPHAEVATALERSNVDVWCLPSSASESGEVFLGVSPGYQFRGLDATLRRVDAIFEFHAYGLALLDAGRGDIDVFVAKPLDKVGVPGGATISLVNLGDSGSPLVAVSVQRDAGEVNDRGPLLVGTVSHDEVAFTVNQGRVLRQRGRGGIVTGHAWTRDQRTIRIPNDARVSLGAFLYKELTSNAKWVAAFDRLNLHLHTAEPTVILPQSGARNPIYCSLPLLQLQHESALYAYLDGRI